MGVVSKSNVVFNDFGRPGTIAAASGHTLTLCRSAPVTMPCVNEHALKRDQVLDQELTSECSAMMRQPASTSSSFDHMCCRG